MSNAKLLISAYQVNQLLPQDHNEVVFVGKSNVGKSSLINALLRRKNLAYVGKTAGKTRCINFYEVNETLMFCDVPGYGYAKRNMDETITYDKLMNAYFNRKNIQLVIMVVDGKVGPTQDDIDMLEYLQYHHFKIMVVMNKIDKANQSTYSKSMNQFVKEFGIGKEAIYPVSSTSLKGIEKLKSDIQLQLNSKF